MRLTKYGQHFLLKAWLLLTATLLGICVLSLAVLGIASLVTREEEPSIDASDSLTGEGEGQESPEPDLPTVEPSTVSARLLGQTAVAEQDYIDSMVFLGESTTAHLRSRGVLSEGVQTKQVWSNSSNTMTLDLNILQKTIVYPKTEQSMTIAEAVALEKPSILVLSFGTNGIMGFEKNVDMYRTSYGRLIDAVHAASPDTVVLLQTVYPLATNQRSFGEHASTMNAYIDRLNAQLPLIAEQHDAYVVDTASCLKDDMGFLRSDYQNGDGVHLTASAYRAILDYLRTHAYTAQ